MSGVWEEKDLAAHAPVRRVRSACRAALSAVVAACTLAAVASPSAAAASDSAELVSRTNSSRAQAGVASLSTHAELMARAQEWSNYMASQGRISHSNAGSRVKARWEKIGENVGVGSSVAEVHRMFMASAGHRRNIMDPAFQYIGVGTTWRDGRVYVSEIFMRLGSGGSAAPAAPVRRVAPRVSRSASRAAAPAPAPPVKPEVPVRIRYSLDELRGVSLG